ncbi:MAG: T9SS C-terminal target domain-containing protein, partial [Flavobacteriia bacterium]|nr:T9SS C-terminal target domain-containing protein [Flavobacteriia bacterium]
NNPIIPFTSIQMSLPCNCSNYPACLSLAGVNEMGIAENGPRIYPNPTREFIYIEVPQLTSQGAEVRIFNVQGGLVESLNLDQSKAQFNIQYLPNGMYNVVILAPNFYWNTRLSVVH